MSRARGSGCGRAGTMALSTSPARFATPAAVPPGHTTSQSSLPLTQSECTLACLATDKEGGGRAPTGVASSNSITNFSFLSVLSVTDTPMLLDLAGFTRSSGILKQYQQDVVNTFDSRGSSAVRLVACGEWRRGRITAIFSRYYCSQTLLDTLLGTNVERFINT